MAVSSALALLCFGLICAGIFGASVWLAVDRRLRINRYQQTVRDDADAEGGTSSDRHAASASSLRHSSRALDERIVERACLLSRTLSLGHGMRLVPGKLATSKWLDAHAPKAGLSGEMTVEGFCEARVRMSLTGAAAGALVGCMFSIEFAAVLLAVGAVLGFQALPWAIRRRIRWRAQEMERHLPEMLDVVALGMRSGLSFDRSLLLYVRHFDTLLARAFDLALRQWECGLVVREEALRGIATTYDSPLFARVIESIIRSLRFGSSMVEGLEACAGEARTNCRAHRQEQVAKAPVKMMIPTGALILPAMLILVLGPVLLELAGDF